MLITKFASVSLTLEWHYNVIDWLSFFLKRAFKHSRHLRDVLVQEMSLIELCKDCSDCVSNLLTFCWNWEVECLHIRAVGPST